MFDMHGCRLLGVASSLGHGDQQPGPGQYNADVAASRVCHPQSPAHSIAARWVPDREAERRPAPGEYDADYQVGSRGRRGVGLGAGVGSSPRKGPGYTMSGMCSVGAEWQQ